MNHRFTLKNSLTIAWMSLKFNLDEGLITAIRMGLGTFWCSWCGTYNIIEADEPDSPSGRKP